MSPVWTGRGARRRSHRVLVAAAVAALAACGGDDESRIVVFAASSLTDVLADMEAAFEAGHPGTDVVVNTAGSSALAAQIAESDLADVFVPADLETLARLPAAAGASQPVVIATNSLEIVVARGNPLGIAGLADLADPELVVVLADPIVPAGRYAEAALASAGVEVVADSYEPDVRRVLAKVVAGEADAGIVYVSDVLFAADAVSGVSIPESDNVVAQYPLVTVYDGDTSAAEFVAFVRGAAGRAVLADHGLGLP